MKRMTDIHTIISEIIIDREETTFTDTLQILADEYRWSSSLSGFSGKLSRESLRYRESLEIADVLGYDIVWVKRSGGSDYD